MIKGDSEVGCGFRFFVLEWEGFVVFGFIVIFKFISDFWKELEWFLGMYVCFVVCL